MPVELPAEEAGRPEPRSRVDFVYRLLREAIIDGERAPGAPLLHQELADTYGVSLIPIREAIRKLEVERLVESIPNKGARVAPISAADVEDVYETRKTLEEQALRKAIPNLSADEVAEIRALRDEMVALVKRDDSDFYELHRRVHFSLYEKSDSPWLIHMIEILWSHTERYRRLAARVRSFVDVGDDHHGRILAAIEAGQIENAVKALRDDLERTSKLVIQAYRDGVAG
jgi:DNA-binding GntR family transcriptional regulator